MTRVGGVSTRGRPPTWTARARQEAAGKPGRLAIGPGFDVRTWRRSVAGTGTSKSREVAVTPAIRAKATELTAGLTGDDEKIRALYAFVSARIHYVALSFGIGRYRPHPAEEVLDNEYGDCKDKHTLLAALLKAAGYDACRP